MRPSHALDQTRPRTARFAACVLALALAGFIAPTAPRAAAVPVQNWLPLSAVQTLLQASPNGVPGHFSTVVGGPTVGQQTPVSMPLSVLGVVPNAGLAGDLILVRLDLSDPRMARIGNIASGMSGSPVVVRSGGADKLIGALSYGDIFTTQGLALATPIEDMFSVEAAGMAARGDAPAAAKSRAIPPVRVDGRTINRVVVGAPSPTDKGAKASGSAGSGAESSATSSTAYFTPLMGVQISGLPARSAAYRRLEAGALKRGLQVLAPHGGAAAGPAAGFEPTLVPGASAGSFLSLGDLSFGGLATLTYTTSNGGAVAFGHPFLWSGATAAYFTDAWIEGVWSSSLASSKLGSPGRERGTVVQDRAAGVGARLGAVPPSVPVTASATVTTNGRVASASGKTRVAPAAFDTWLRSDLPAAAAVQPVLRAADVEVMPGSAKTTLVVRVSDGVKEHEIRRSNMFDSNEDVLGMPASEVYDVIETVLSNEDGTTPATIKSVDLTTKVTSARAQAVIRGVTSPGLRTGSNIISVKVRPFGSKVDTIVPVRLTIPPRMPLQGTITVNAGEDFEQVDEDTSIAARVARLNAAPANSDVVVAFRPEESETPAVRGVAPTAWVIDGYAEAVTSSTTLESSQTRVTAGQWITLTGSVSPARTNDTVKVERRTLGTPTWRTIKAAAKLSFEDEEATFEVADRPLTNSVYRVSYAGNDGILGSSAAIGVAVRGRVRLTGTPTKTGFTLVASVAPRTAGATITFQRYWRGKWQPIKAVKTGATGQARLAWRPQKGTYLVRAVLTGSSTLSGAVSPSIRLRR